MSAEPTAEAMTHRRQSVIPRERLLLWFGILMAIGLAVSFIPGFEEGILGLVKKQISFNSEAFALALLVTIELAARQRSGPRKWLGLWWGFLVVAYLAIVLLDGLHGGLVTLNESILGALLISIFLTLFDPNADAPRNHRWVFPLVAGVIALLGELLIGAWEDVASWIMRNAETLGFAILVSILFGYLTSYPWSDVRSSKASRTLWVLGLIAIPLGVAAVNPHGVDAVAAVGPIESLMVWIQRITESFVAAVFLTALCWTMETTQETGESDATESVS